MRSMIVMLGLAGVVFGVLSASLMHVLPVGELGWFAFTPLPEGSTNWLRVTPAWMPSILVVPAVGLAAGVLGALALHRLGWRLVRRPPED